jgi:hypothetical protein
MTEWTVFLQTDDGIQMHVVKADFAEFDDENGRLLFSNLKVGMDALAMLAALNVGSVDDKEKFAVFQKASKKLGQMSVAHFEKASVLG